GTVGGRGEVLLDRHDLAGDSARRDGDPGDGPRAPARRLQRHVVGPGNHIDERLAGAPSSDGRRGDPGLVVTDVHVDSGDPLPRLVHHVEQQVPVGVGVGVGETGLRIEVIGTRRAGVGAHATVGEHRPDERDVLAMVEVLVGGEDAVAGVQHAGQRRGVGQRRGDKQRSPLLAGRLTVLGNQALAQLPQRRGPDLAVGVHLVADDVVAEIAVVQRALVVVVVADAAAGVAGDVDAFDRLRLQARVEQVVQRVPVAPALTHGAGLLAAEYLAAADHAVGHAVGVLVLDNGKVVV